MPENGVLVGKFLENEDIAAAMRKLVAAFFVIWQ